MTHFGLSVKETYSEITDEQIESIIGDVQSLHPNWENCLMHGYFISIGIRVPLHIE